MPDVNTYDFPMRDAVSLDRELEDEFDHHTHLEMIKVVAELRATIRGLEAENARLREAIELLDAECERRQQDVSELSVECERWHDEVASMDHARDCKGGRWYNGAGLCNCARSLLIVNQASR